MEFYLTKYIYPLESKIYLSKTLGYYFDNPRSINEIDIIKKAILNNFNLSLFSSDTEYQSITIEEAFKKIISLFPPEDSFAKSKVEQFKDDPAIFISSSIILLRSENKDAESMWYNPKKENRDEPLWDSNEHLTMQSINEYISLLSFLIEYDEDNEGTTFLIDTSSIEEHKYPTAEQLTNIILINSIFNTRRSTLFKHNIFNDHKERILKYSSLIEKQILKNLTDKILYIGGLIILATEVRDYRISFMTIIGIIELLIAHNPDMMRFNIEDSINKQFQLKTATTIYLADNNINLAELREELKLYYNLRSKIVHGDFNELKKILTKYSPHSDLELYLGEITGTLFKYLSIVLNVYLEKPEFINFLKTS